MSLELPLYLQVGWTQFHSTCAVCASHKTPTPKPRSPLQSVKAGFPMQSVAVDILGPLPESEAGNKYILVTGDHFTRWMEAYSIPNQATVATNELFCRFSIPEQLHSDQGRQFESKIIAQVCKLLKIERMRTTPYHPQSDGVIERFNRTLLTCTDQHPFDCCMAYNTSKQSTTGYSPFFLMFGREARLPIDVMYAPPHPETSLPQYVQNLRSILTEVFHHVREGAQQERQQEFYNNRVHGVVIQSSSAPRPGKEIPQTLDRAISDLGSALREQLSHPEYSESQGYGYSFRSTEGMPC